MSAAADSPQPPPQAWIDTLARARTDLAAGRTHELEDVLRDLDGDIAEIGGKRADPIWTRGC